jgi:hypothetical protein
MYFPDNVAGLTALTERISVFLRRWLSLPLTALAHRALQALER